ncbi:hypothetical protein PD374_22085 [Pseudomonas sp. WCS374]|nr:hypothetical protein PD374_22085 [Pseudomonas sp. WCS374]
MSCRKACNNVPWPLRRNRKSALACKCSCSWRRALGAGVWIGPWRMPACHSPKASSATRATRAWGK